MEIEAVIHDIACPLCREKYGNTNGKLQEQEVDGMDYQILLEADYLVNADEGGYDRSNLQNAADRLFKTATGKEILLKSIFPFSSSHAPCWADSGKCQNESCPRGATGEQRY